MSDTYVTGGGLAHDTYWGTLWANDDIDAYLAFVDRHGIQKTGERAREIFAEKRSFFSAWHHAAQKAG